MSEPPGPRNYPSQPDGPMEPGPRQPPSHGGYQPQQPPQTGYEQRPQSETEFQQRPQPQTGYQQQPRQGYQQQPQHGYQQQPQRGYQQQPPYAPRQAYSVHQPSEETTRDAQAALAARMELGPEYSEYVAPGRAGGEPIRGRHHRCGPQSGGLPLGAASERRQWGPVLTSSPRARSPPHA